MKKILEKIEEVYPISKLILIDIGARWGFQRPWNNFPEKKLRYYGFDADEEECSKLNTNNKNKDAVVYLPYALLDKESGATLYLTQEEGCSSIYEPNYKVINKYFYNENWKLKKEIKVKTTTLKKVFLKNKIDPDFIKIDTQGAELSILKGASGYLENVLGLELEVEFLEMYKGQPLFSDIDSFVRGKGFELYDLNRYWANRVNIGKYHINRGQLVFGDAIYFRSVDSFYSLKLTDEMRKDKLLKLILILSLYGFFDAALDYITHASSPLNSIEKALLIKTLSDTGKIAIWQKILFNNSISNKAGRFFKILGNLLSFPLNTAGWGSDYNGIDGRYRYIK